jgi:hypothetical protein
MEKSQGRLGVPVMSLNPTPPQKEAAVRCDLFAGQVCAELGAHHRQGRVARPRPQVRPGAATPVDAERDQ